MTLPLPFKVDTGAPNADSEAVQGNFDALASRFPVSRKDMLVEFPHFIDGPDEPAFANGWVNYDTSTFYGARFWRDPVGMVHIEGRVKSGTIGAVPIFTLPDGYRPANGHEFNQGQINVAPTGEVMAVTGSNTSVSLSGISFKQEQ